jgi:hypothetical protein
MDLDNALREIEGEIEKGGYSIQELGFWKLVAGVKKDPELIKKYADRIGRIDQKIFKDRAPFTLSIGMGNLLEFTGIVLGLAILLWGAAIYRGAYGWIIPLLAAFVLSTAVHPLAHLLAGKLFGIRFTFYFLDGPMKIEPTLKTDYASYLRAPPEKRAMMHLAGAMATTSSPLLVLVLAYFLDAPYPSLIVLAALFLFFLSTEFIPLALNKLGSPKILGLDFRKSDSYRAMREWKLA